jgi:hypothetical protein
MKPLEPGCLALATLPADAGVPIHAVTCITRIDLVPRPPEHQIWLIDSPLSGPTLCCSCCLTRIDGDPDAVPEKTDEELTA